MLTACLGDTAVLDADSRWRPAAQTAQQWGQVPGAEVIMTCLKPPGAIMQHSREVPLRPAARIVVVTQRAILPSNEMLNQMRRVE